jgi:hypothetical protein
MELAIANKERKAERLINIICGSMGKGGICGVST